MPFRFESLDIWHMARDYSRKVYSATARFPRHEDYGLRSQMNRAANSIGLNIAEGSGKGSNKAFDYHLEVAIGSTFEVAAASFLAATMHMLRPTSREYCMTRDRSWQRALMLFEIRCHDNIISQSLAFPAPFGLALTIGHLLSAISSYGS